RLLDRSKVDDQVPALAEAEFLHFVEERFVDRFAQGDSSIRSDVAHAGDRVSWLHDDGEPPRAERGTKQSQQVAPLHRIASSDGTSSAGGIVRPRAFAVLRLMARSNFTGCSIGKSAGLAPLRILSA